jgi:hypothetical protein
MGDTNKEPAWITLLRLKGETVYTKNGKYNPIKSASVEEPQKSIEVEEQEVPDWLRIRNFIFGNS